MKLKGEKTAGLENKFRLYMFNVIKCRNGRKKDAF